MESSGKILFCFTGSQREDDLAAGCVKVQNMKIRETDKGQTARAKMSRGNGGTEVCLASFVTLSRIVISNIEYIIPAPGGR